MRMQESNNGNREMDKWLKRQLPSNNLEICVWKGDFLKSVVRTECYKLLFPRGELLQEKKGI